jgi:hypothetical protein
VVYSLIKTRNKVFLETLVITLLILLIGFSIGFFIESYRTSKVIEDYKIFEVSALDLKLQNYYYDVMDNASCNIAVQSNLNFADQIYSKGLILDQYEKANDISDTILPEKKQYVLLDAGLWMNSISLKRKCNNPFHTIVYVYSQTKDTSKQAEQTALSSTLKIIKQEKGNNLILIPIAGDLGLDSVDMQLKLYNVTYLPSVIIDEKVVLSGFHNIGQIESYL